MKNLMKIECRAIKENERGFTIVEVMMALSILVIGILGIAVLQVSSINSNASAKGSTEGYTWAMDRVENLMNLPYDHPDLNVGSNGPIISPDNAYEIKWTVAESAVIQRTKNIHVVVEWTWGFSSAKKVELDVVLPQVY